MQNNATACKQNQTLKKIHWAHTLSPYMGLAPAAHTVPACRCSPMVQLILLSWGWQDCGKQWHCSRGHTDYQLQCSAKNQPADEEEDNY